MIKFGPSGNSLSFYAEGYEKTEQAAKFVRERGLDCFEYSFGRGVRMSDKTAASIRNAFDNEGIEISVHAPYYINFANPDPIKAENSYGYVLQSAYALQAMGGKRCVFHPASQGKEDRKVAVDRTYDRLCILRDKVYEQGLEHLIYCPETMGKLGQIGTVDEIAKFCTIDRIFVPCIDFGHVNAREQGSLKTVRDYTERLESMIETVGYEKMKHFHAHFSKIEYSAKGEVKHLTFADTVYGPEFEPLAEALVALKLEPYIVSESDGMQAEEAKLMKEAYFSRLNG